ncbi:TerC family protein [Nocardioides astragali]|uniref:TerC family protein n=1 Tax=Nocardioides astragali TaxID=1776736 RepID=A0ABW2N2N7_9ACTN|nr:TerC family protein [Nocardioides astragali]
MDSTGVPASVWLLTVLLLTVMVAVDLGLHVRRPHCPTLRESAIWSAGYVGIALVFGLAVLAYAGPASAAAFYAGYVTEKALSVDNLFVFLVIVAAFRVPREHQQKVLLYGVVLALVVRTGFIFLGVALIERFSWTFYVFGLALLLTAGKSLRPPAKTSSSRPDAATHTPRTARWARRLLPDMAEYDGERLVTRRLGRWQVTPLLAVLVAIGATDLLFALDSIPAIFGLTQNVYIVFTATAFSLLGLRQLYFLLDGLLERLAYLAYGLAAILGFIGIKLMLHALHENTVPFINDGQPVPVHEVGTGTSLLVILGILTVTVVASLTSRRARSLGALATAERQVRAYLDPAYTKDPAERERLLEQIRAQAGIVRSTPSGARALDRASDELHAVLSDTVSRP